MILDVVKYGTPVLRQKGAPLEAITPETKKLVADMLDTMEAANGVGLAAQQIGRALQLAVIDVSPVTDRPSTLELEGEPADVASFMPLVLINPTLKPHGAEVTSAEGCLSFPEIYAPVTRPEFVEVTTLNLKGETVSFRAGGLLARAIQHEADHLNGILFIDRMDKAAKAEIKPELELLQLETKAALKK